VGEDRAARACRATAAALRAASIATEALASFEPEGKRLLVLRRPAIMRPIGEVWRLGTLLLDTDAKLWAAGRATRAAERGRVGYQSVSREERREIAAAALRGGYPEGTPVNFDAVAMPLEASALRALDADAPIGVSDGEVRVRWRSGAPLQGAPTLAQYLSERADLLIHRLRA